MSSLLDFANVPYRTESAIKDSVYVILPHNNIIKDVKRHCVIRYVKILTCSCKMCFVTFLECKSNSCCTILSSLIFWSSSAYTAVFSLCWYCLSDFSLNFLSSCSCLSASFSSPSFLWRRSFSSSSSLSPSSIIWV